jgi:hypothetical protein
LFPVLHEYTCTAHITGNVVSNIIVSVVSLVVFCTASRNLIYTVLFASPAVIVCPVVLTHGCRLVGPAVLPNAISTPHAPASVAQVILRVTEVPVAYVAPLFTENDPPVGGEVSTVNSPVLLNVLVL